jgi:hypothetical protein
MRADVRDGCAEVGIGKNPSPYLTRWRTVWQTFLGRVSPVARWSWPLTIAVALIYVASFATFIRYHTSLPFYDGYGYVVKTRDLAEKFHDASFLQRLNPGLYFGEARPERPPLLMAIAAIVLGPNPTNAGIAYVWLAVRVGVILLALYLLSRELGTARFVPAAALVIFGSPLMCNFYRLYFMDEPFAAFGLLAFTLILIDDRRQTMWSALAASTGILALFLVKPVAPAFVFAFCVIRAARALLPVCLDRPNFKSHAGQLLEWAVPYFLLLVLMAALVYASRYGPAIRELYKLGVAGYWSRDVTAGEFIQLTSLVWPPWLLLTLLVALPFSGRFGHRTVTLYALGGLLWWLLFSFCLTYTVSDRLVGQAMPYVVAAILVWVCQRPTMALVVTLVAAAFFTYNIRVANGLTKPRSHGVAAMIRFFSPVPQYQQPVPEVGLLPFARRLNAAIMPQESEEVYGIFGDTYVEPSPLNMALQMTTQPQRVRMQRLPANAMHFDLREICQTQWFITKTRRQASGFANTGLWTTINCVHALITDGESPLHPYFRKVLEHPVHQPDLEDTLVLWHLPSSPPRAAIAESLRWLEPRLVNDPPAFRAVIESQLKALSTNSSTATLTPGSALLSP